MSHRLEGQQREEVLEECHALADELHQWMLSTRSALCSTPQDADVEDQLEDCQVRVPPAGLRSANGQMYKKEMEYKPDFRLLIQYMDSESIINNFYLCLWLECQIVLN